MRRISALFALLTLAACSPGGAPPAEDARTDSAPGSADVASSPAGGDAAPGIWPPFRDATAEAGLKFWHFNGMTGEMYFSEMVGPGAALFDLEGDGDLDLFVVQGSPLRDGDDPTQSIRPPRHPLPLVDRLYRNELQETGSLRFTDITDRSGLDSRGYGMGVASGDIDNDGYPDLYVTNFGDNALWRNRGDGTFEDVTERSGTGEGRWSVAATFFDYDRDGWLDLFVGNYVEYSIGSHKRCRAATGATDYCGPHSYATETDRLFRNRGDGTFEDVTSRLGLDRAAGGTLGVVEADFDLDGSLDLYVANDGVANHLWMPRSGAFSDEALLRGAALNRDGHAEAGMGVDAGDVDNDGDEDIFLTHLTQETNTLYSNLGNATFDDVTSVRGLGAPSWEGTGFGTGFLDFDLDGWLDLVVLNGAVKVIEEQRGEDHPLHQPNQLYRNRGDGHFEEIDGGDAFAPSAVSRGVAIGDVDND
ncbi:MAG: VCBS repeat-containing protein, partial [Acidobacteriota bacterium]